MGADEGQDRGDVVFLVSGCNLTYYQGLYQVCGINVPNVPAKTPYSDCTM
jgi:hypothetical protein